MVLESEPLEGEEPPAQPSLVRQVPAVFLKSCTCSSRTWFSGLPRGGACAGRTQGRQTRKDLAQVLVQPSAAPVAWWVLPRLSWMAPACSGRGAFATVLAGPEAGDG